MASTTRRGTVKSSGRDLALRGISVNFLGQALPALLALLTLPAIARGLAQDRFGLLGLAWVTVGYFSIFDLGLGRALTKEIAETRHADQGSIPSLILSTSVALLALASLGGLALFAIAGPLTSHVLNIPYALRAEAAATFRLLALCIPAVVLSSALRGALEGYQEFTLVNLIGMPAAVTTFAGPWVMLHFTKSLPYALLPLAAARFLTPVAFLTALAIILRVRKWPRLEIARVGRMFRFGGWVTFSGIVSPLMVTLDRYLIGSVLAVSAVGYYTAAVDTSAKLWIVPQAVIRVLFPVFAAALVTDRSVAGAAYDKAFKLVAVLMFPLTLWIVGLADFGLLKWLGPLFAKQSTVCLQITMIGAFIYATAHIPAELINAAGQPRKTAFLRILEVPFYLPALLVLTKLFGINGAAMAWTGRITFDTLALMALAKGAGQHNAAYLGKHIRLCGLCAAAASGVAFLSLIDVGQRVLPLAAITAGFAALVWKCLLDEQDRAWLQLKAGMSRPSIAIQEAVE